MSDFGIFQVKSDQDSATYWLENSIHNCEYNNTLSPHELVSVILDLIDDHVWTPSWEVELTD